MKYQFILYFCYQFVTLIGSCDQMIVGCDHMMEMFDLIFDNMKLATKKITETIWHCYLVA